MIIKYIIKNFLKKKNCSTISTVNNLKISYKDIIYPSKNILFRYSDFKYNNRDFLKYDFLKFQKFLYSNNNNYQIREEIKFLTFCKLINSLEKENSYLKKQDLYINLILENLKRFTKNNQKEIFEDIGNIIKLTVPSLFFVEENENNKNDKGELIRNQYNFKNILERFAEENILNNQYKNQDNLDIKKLAKHSGGIYNFISDNYQLNYKLCENNSIEFLKINDIIKYKSEANLSTGKNSFEIKIQLFQSILSRCSDKMEVYYLSRLFTNQMSCGISTKSIIKCLKIIENIVNSNESKKKSDYKFIPRKEDFYSLIDYLEENIFKYSIGSNSKIDIIEKNDLLNQKNNPNGEISVKPGKYLDLCLCKPGINLDDLMKIIEEKKYLKILSEIKFDGERSQMHFDGINLKMGSRKFEHQKNLYDSLYNEINNNIIQYNENNKNSQIKNFILDGEIICYENESVHLNRETANNNIKILDFQELRKKNIKKKINEIKYIFVAFDILIYNDFQVYKYPLEKRKEILKKIFYKKLNTIIIESGKTIECNHKKDDYSLIKEKITSHFNYARKINCEGLIIKFLGEKTFYHFGKRKWLKVNI